MKKLFSLLTVFACALSAQAQLNQYQRVTPVKDIVLDPAYAPFYHGVASGDPLQDAVIIWTRVSPSAQANCCDGTWEMAYDLSFNQIAQTGTFNTDANVDYTVKVDVTGLNPGTFYYYRFIVGSDTSVVGRTKTAPASGLEHTRMGVVSCINFQAGYFNGLRRLANREDLDLIVVLGDYIYEYGEGGYGYDSAVGRGHEPDHEMVSLEDYRLRYSFYRLDPDLRRAHQLYPFIVVWDDHESTNDSYKDGAENHQPDTEGDWYVRKENMSTAYHEWMPIRTPDLTNKEKIYRSFKFGDLFDLIMIDTRIVGRDAPISSSSDSAYADPNRTILGKEQWNWLKKELKNSTARYKILGNQVMLTQFNQAPGQPFNLDAWDGFPQERDSVLKFVAGNNINNFIVLTGDIHTSWASNLTVDPTNPLVYNPNTGDGSVGVEFVTPSITSDNFNEITGTPPGSSESVESAVLQANPQLQFVELDDHGYFILDLDGSRAQAESYVGEILTPDLDESLLAMWKTNNGSNKLEEATVLSSPKPIFYPSPEEPQSRLDIEEAGIELLGIYPNPVVQNCRLQFGVNNSEPVMLSLFNTKGQLVQTWQLNTDRPGVYQQDLSLSHLAKGQYIFSITGKNANASMPIIKQ